MERAESLEPLSSLARGRAQRSPPGPPPPDLLCSALLTCVP